MEPADRAAEIERLKQQREYLRSHPTPLRLLQIGLHDWITLTEVPLEPHHVIHEGPHVIDTGETLIDYRVQGWVLDARRRWLIGWADSLAEAEQLAHAQWAEWWDVRHSGPISVP